MADFNLAQEMFLLFARGGAHNMFRYGYVPPIWVGFWARNSLDKGPFFGRFSINMGGLSTNWQKIAKNWFFPPKLIIKLGMATSFGIRGGYLSENRVADPCPSASHVPPGSFCESYAMICHDKRSIGDIFIVDPLFKVLFDFCTT